MGRHPNVFAQECRRGLPRFGGQVLPWEACPLQVPTFQAGAREHSGTRGKGSIIDSDVELLDGVKGKLRTMSLSVRVEAALVPWYVAMADCDSERKKKGWSWEWRESWWLRSIEAYWLGICLGSRGSLMIDTCTLLEPESYCTHKPWA